MSAGKFQLTKYEASYKTGEIHPIRLQEETTLMIQDSAGVSDATNLPPAGNVNNSISALSSLNRNARGLRPRYIVVKWDDKPTGYSGETVRIPILTIANWNNLTVGETVTYLGKTAKIITKEPERVR